MKSRILTITAILLCLSINLYSQADFRPGFIINNDGDTVWGQIDYKGDNLMGGQCKFSTDMGTTFKVYSPLEIEKYGFKDGKLYISESIPVQDITRPVFLEYLVSGCRMNLYYLREESVEHFYIQKDEGEIVELPYHEEIVVDSIYFKHHLKKSTEHIGLLLYYMQDAPQLKSKITSMKKPDYKMLISLVKKYNEIVCPGQASIDYEKKAPAFSINPEIIAGYIHYSHGQSLKGNGYFTGGIAAHIWMPRINEKLFIRTGINAVPWKAGDNSGTFFRIPIQLEYTSPVGKFRPSIAYGNNIYIDKTSRLSMNMVSMNLGGLYKINKVIYISLNAEFEFLPGSFPIFPKQFVSWSIFGGLYFRIISLK